MYKNDIIGIWKSDPNDPITQQEFGDITIEFRNNGELIYTIYEKDKKQTIYMNYEINGDEIVSDQPSSPTKVITKFKLLSDGKLELIYEGISSIYLKI